MMLAGGRAAAQTETRIRGKVDAGSPFSKAKVGLDSEAKAGVEVSVEGTQTGGETRAG